MRIKNRDIRFPLHIKVDRRNIVERSHRILHRSHQYLPNGLFVLKLNFCFGWVDIYIDILRLNIKINKVRNLLSLWQKPIKGRLNRLTKIRVTHKTPVHKEILLCPFLFCRFGLTHKTANTTNRSINVNRQKILINTLSKHINYTLT